MTWRDLTDEDIRSIRRAAHLRYRPRWGRPLAALIADRKAARLRAGRAGKPTQVEIDNAIALRAVELVGEGWEPTAAFARAMAEIERTGGAS